MSELHRLADVAVVFNGKTPSKAEQRETGFPVLKIKNVSETGEFRGTFSSFVDEKLANKHMTRWIKNGDTLILNAAHNADYVASKLFLADDSVAGSLPTGEWLLVRPNSHQVSPNYLHYWLRSSGTCKAIRFIVKGIHLYPKDVAELTIPLPSLTEQRRIVDILSRAEGIVRLRREAQKKTAEIIPALFIDMFGDPATNLKGWPVVSLSEVSEVISGVAKGRMLSADGVIELPYMRVANVKDGHLDLTEIKTILIKQTEVAKLRIELGDLLMTEGGDPDKLGRAALWQGEIDLCVHQNHIFKVRSNRSRLSPGYLRSLAGSLYGKTYFLSVAKKTTGIASINKTQLSAFPVVLPPIREQLIFEKYIAAIESIEKQQTDALRKTEATFNALMARSFDHVGNIAPSKQVA